MKGKAITNHTAVDEMTRGSFRVHVDQMVELTELRTTVNTND